MGLCRTRRGSRQRSCITVQIKDLNQALLKSGLEVMDDKKSQLIERIKTIVIEQIHYADEPLDINFSDFLVSKLNYDYVPL